MDKDRVKGAIDDAAGRAKRQVGEWTGNTSTQVEGAVQQVKGKAEKAWGEAKDIVRDTTKAFNDASRDTGNSDPQHNAEEHKQNQNSKP